MSSSSDTKEICAIGCSRDREVTPCQRSFAKAEKDAIQAVDLLDCKFFAVLTEISGKLVDLPERDSIDPQTVGNDSLTLTGSVYADQPVLEGSGIILDALSRFDAGLSPF